MKNKKAQALMEFVFKYGWIVVAVCIAIAVFLFIRYPKTMGVAYIDYSGLSESLCSSYGFEVLDYDLNTIECYQVLPSEDKLIISFIANYTQLNERIENGTIG